MGETQERKGIQAIELRAELVEAPPIESNLAALQRMCIEAAQDMRLAGTIRDHEDYRQAKRDRTAVNKMIRQVEDERKRVKAVWMGPYVTFETGVKSSLGPLREVKERVDGAIAAYEGAARDAKRERLRAFWEREYPALALVVGEASEPLVPFERVFRPDWVKRLGELDRDEAAENSMRDTADALARGAQMIAELNEPEQVKRMALSELYRTLDPVRAMRAAKEESRRLAAIDALGASADVPGVPEVAPEPPQEAACAPEAPGPAPEPMAAPDGPQAAPEPPAAPARRAVYVVTIECETLEEVRRVREAMVAAGVHGTIRKVHSDE